MNHVKVLNAKDIEAYTGPHEIPGIRFRHARRQLGVTAWGMNVVELDPGAEGYPEHDHKQDGQEEVYVVLEGSALLRIEGEEKTLVQGDMVRVPPELKRKWVTTRSSARILAIGGAPGVAYEVTNM